MGDLQAWLESIGLADCLPLLERHDIDLEVLADLTDADLAEIGLSLGKRRKLLRAVAALAAPAPVPATPPPPAGRGERRQVTVMFADLVGSTRLSVALDPEELQAVLRRSLDAIATACRAHSGHVAKFLGDGVLVYFGWPQAEEDAAEEATRAGLRVVEAVRATGDAGARLQVRVGIATGLVVIGDVLGEGSAREQVVTGATANLAARLQAEATPDGVLIAAATRRLLGDLFVLEPAGPFQLKGFDGPVEAFRVLSERDDDNRFAALRQGTTGGLMGRSADLALLARCWERAAAGAGQVVFVSGEPGMGKTRLVESFLDGLPAHQRLRLQCLPHHGSTALHPVIAAIRRAAGIQPQDDEPARVARLAALLERAGLAPARAGPLGEVLGLKTAAPVAADFDPAARKRQALAGLVDYVSHLAAQAPLVVQLEDVQWSDPTTLELAGLLAAAAAGLPLLLVATARPEASAPWPAAGHAHAIALGRLEGADSIALLHDLVGEPLPADITARILAKTDGIPLYVEELVRELIDSGALRREAGGWVLATGESGLMAVPATLSDSLVARLDRLGWAKEIAQISAVIGRTFGLPLVEPLPAMPASRVREALRLLVGSKLVTEAGEDPLHSHGFRHALIQDAAYGGLLLSERRRLHAEIAQLLEERFPAVAEMQPELVAHHHAEARQPAEATEWWRRAARRSVAAVAYAEAATQYRRALEQLALTPEGPERDRQESKLLVELLTPLQGIEGYTGERVRAVIERAVELSARTGDEALFPALAGQLSLAYGGSQMIRAVAIGEQLLEAAGRSGERGHRMFAHWTMGMALMGRGRLEAARASLEAALAMSDPAEDAVLALTQTSNPRVAALAYLSLVMHQLGFPDEALALDRQSVAEAQAGEHSVTIGLALTLRLSLALLRGDRDMRTAAAGALAAHAQRQESRPLMAVAGTVLGLLAATDTADEAILGAARHTIGLLRDAGWNLMVGWLSLLEAEVLLGHGQVEAANGSLAALEAVLAPRGHDFFLPELRRLQALAAAKAGAPATAEALLGDSLALARAQSARSAEDRAAHDLALLRQAGLAAGARLRAAADLP